MIGGRWIAIAGDLHGDVSRLERLLRRFERAASAEVVLVLQVGDLELPDDARPLRGAEVVFIDGNHDKEGAAAPGWTSLGRSGVVERHGVRIGGLSGTYHPKLSEEPAAPGAGAGEHCTRDDVAALLAARLDVLLLH
ncbi:MAG: metallophosphoesterase family protein, partial [Planctomycetota bacterium]